MKMADCIQLRVNCGSTTKLIVLSKDSSIDEIYRAMSKELCVGHQAMQLHHEAEVLKYGESTILKDYNLVHLSRIDLLVGVLGGIWPLKAIQDRKRDLVPLPGFITVTTSPNDVDMISLVADEGEKRAKMPCGHVIGPSSMTSYCQSVLSEGRFRFLCPSVDENGKSNCDREWEYFLVRHVACLSEEEKHEFEKKISENCLQKSIGMQQCPGCNTWCYKTPETKQCVRCQMCKKSFCWACLRDWKGASDGRVCGNAECDGRDNRAKILEECDMKTINNCKSCPSIRACPKCFILVEHKDKCGHMICPSCKHGFCMICLKPKTATGWSCSSGGSCPVAPRQTPSEMSSSESSQSNCTIL